MRSLKNTFFMFIDLNPFCFSVVSEIKTCCYLYISLGGSMSAHLLYIVVNANVGHDSSIAACIFADEWTTPFQSVCSDRQNLNLEKST